MPEAVSARVRSERWGSDRTHLEEPRLFWHQRQGQAGEGRLTSKRPRGAAKLYGFDEAGSVVTARRWYFEDDVDFDWFRDGDDAVWLFRDAGVRVARTWHEHGRTVAAGFYAHEGWWSIDSYHRSPEQHVTTIEVLSADTIAWERGERATTVEHLELAYAGDDVIEIVRRETGDPVFVHPRAGGDRDLDRVMQRLVAEVERGLAGLPADTSPQAVALRYQRDRPLPPEVEVLSVAEAAAFERSEDVDPLNPEEWHHSATIGLSTELRRTCDRLTAVLVAEGAETRGRELLRDASRELNRRRGDVWSYAVETLADELEAEVTQTLLDEQLAAVRERGLL